MTPTRHRVKLIAETCALPCVTQLLGACKEQDLLAWLEAELGDARALDEFLPHGPLQSRAIAPRTILHIVSGNTPHPDFPDSPPASAPSPPSSSACSKSTTL